MEFVSYVYIRISNLSVARVQCTSEYKHRYTNSIGTIDYSIIFIVLIINNINNTNTQVSTLKHRMSDWKVGSVQGGGGGVKTNKFSKENLNYNLILPIWFPHNKFRLIINITDIYLN